MDTLEFKIESKERSGNKIPSVNIFINGKNLIDLLREYEQPFAKKEGQGTIAGSYAGMTPADFLYWFTKADWPSKEQRSILTCADCGEVGCWPMIVSVSETKNSVKWFNFHQPHRKTSWDFNKFPSFEFSKEDYNIEFQKIFQVAEGKKT